jgi:MoaA/NifB/PqqE/SkfB family radical SAM enzyme
MKRSFNFIKNILFSNFYRLSFPYKLTFAVTFKCNLHCKMCSIWKNSCQDELKFKEIYSFFKKSNRFSWIDLTGGEIFLRKDIFDIVEIILDKCQNLKILHFPTNGQFLNETVSLAKKIIESKKVILVVTVSIEGDSKLNDEIRGKGTWEQAIETYKRLKKINRGYFLLGITFSK